MLQRKVAAGLAAVAVGIAGELCGCSAPAAATPTELNGTYTFVVDNARAVLNGAPLQYGVPSTTTWQIVACGPGCSHVTSSIGWNLDFHLVDDEWRATRETSGDCAAGETMRSVYDYVIDAVTLTGTATNFISCGQPLGLLVAPATLTKN